MLRIMYCADLVGAIFLMLEAEVFGQKLICALGFFLGLTCLLMLYKLRNK